MRLLDLLRGEKAPTATSLREALAAAEAERAAAAATLDRLQARRAELLLDGDDRALDVVEKDLVRAQRQADRLDLLTAQVQERLREAEAAERRARLDEIHADGQAALERGLEIYREWVRPARQLRDLALELGRLQSEIDDANRRVLQAGDPRQVGEIDRTARPRVDGEQDLRGPALGQGLRLPSTVHLTHLFYPAVDAWGSFVPEGQRPER